MGLEYFVFNPDPGTRHNVQRLYVDQIDVARRDFVWAVRYASRVDMFGHRYNVRYRPDKPSYLWLRRYRRGLKAARRRFVWRLGLIEASCRGLTWDQGSWSYVQGA